jgi:glucose-6-phosphate 1-dehydrogenase
MSDAHGVVSGAGPLPKKAGLEETSFHMENAVPISGRQAPPCTAVIFGAAGDLTARKLIPAFYNLAKQRLLPSNFAVIGFARREYNDASFREYLESELKGHAPGGFDANVWKWLSERIHYVSGNFDDTEAYVRLGATLASVEKQHSTRGNVLYYLATSPEFFSICARQLASNGLAQEQAGSWRRVIVEKPFGRDLKTARELDKQLHSVLSESQIYRIDHYLGKETVQNIMVFRFANGIFEPIWNRRYVDHVQITVAETLGVEKRGGYYDKSGAMRDMVPNHIFQLISLVAMEPPVSFQADAVRDEQAKVLRAIQPMSPEDVLSRTVRGQYAAGQVGGRMLPDYRSEPNVAPESATETYVAMKLGIDNWRWTDVPFYLRVGKALSARSTEIAIQFKRPPFVLFRNTAVDKLAPNTLILRIQPDEGISLKFGAKVPGATLRLGSVDMDFDYSEHFGAQPATGYERLLYDGMLGDQTLFQRTDMLEASWAVVNPVLDVWSALPPRNFPNYHAGTAGPRDADQLLERDGRAWRPIK